MPPEKLSESEPLLLHVRATAEEMGLSPYQVRNLVKAGTLPHERIGNRTYIPASAVREYVDKIGGAS